MISNLLILSLGSTFIRSHDSSVCNFHVLTLLVRQSVISLDIGSDGSGSMIKDVPLVVISWFVILKSQSVLVCTNMFLHNDSSSSSHIASDLESLFIIERLFSSEGSCLVNSPCQSSSLMVASVER